MPTLYIVATPIGNLSDFSPRGIETLKKVGLIAAEDTRVTMKLLQVFDIHTPLISCHRHNEEDRGPEIIGRMIAEDIDAAVTTDAGTPCVSDPGWAVVRAAVERNIPVLPVPGCCAAVSALSVSGFDTREFAFYGFLPRDKKELREKLLSIARGPAAAVVHESPYRVTELTEAIAQTLPGARVSASCDLTKLHELTVRGTAEEVLAMLRANPKAEKGEYCLVIDLRDVRLPEAGSSAPAADLSEEALLVEAMKAGADLREAQEQVIAQGRRRNAVKAAALNLKRMFGA